jgi:hypothetical protein
MRRWLRYFFLAILLAPLPLLVPSLLRPQPKLEWVRQWPAIGQFMALAGKDVLVISDPNRDSVAAYSLNGRQLWEFHPPHPPGMISGLCADGQQIYIGTNSNWLYALDLAGSAKWQQFIPRDSEEWGIRPTVENGKVWALCYGSNLYHPFDLAGHQAGDPKVGDSFKLYDFKDYTASGMRRAAVVDTYGRTWAVEPKSVRPRNSLLDKLRALVLRKPKQLQDVALLRVTDQAGRVMVRMPMRFSQPLNALALPNGRVLLLGPLGKMYCYLLAP